MILIALCLALLLGLVALGGRASDLTHVQVRWGWLAPLAFLMQAYLIFFPAERAGDVLSPRSLLLVASQVLLFVVIWQNRHLCGIKVIGLGLLLNSLVMVVNGGFMPITPETLVQIGYDGNASQLETGYIVGRTKNVVAEPGEASLWFLSDVMVIPRPFPIPTALSLGDLLIVLGVFFFLREAMFLHKVSASPA
ncbi:MAG: DUF5317 domain-containing protein [Anaerolineae bacterium]